MKNEKTRFYVKKERGESGNYFCGDIHERFPDEKYERESYDFHEKVGNFLSFSTMRKAKNCVRKEYRNMHKDNEYASWAIRSEEKFGVEGVDCDEF